MWSTVAIPGAAAECFTGNGKLAALATMAHSANYSFSCGHPAASPGTLSLSVVNILRSYRFTEPRPRRKNRLHQK